MKKYSTTRHQCEFEHTARDGTRFRDEKEFRFILYARRVCHPRAAEALAES